MTLRSLADTGSSSPTAAEVVKRATALPIEWAGSVEPMIEGLWLVDDWLPAHGVAAIYGHPGSGKSFLAMDMGLRIALGWEVAGRRVEQGLVLYLCAEGQTGFRNRLAAFRSIHDVPASVPFAFIPVSIDLQAVDGDRSKLIAAVREAAAICGQPPRLVVIDTLSKTFGAGKENTDDMASYVANCAAVADAFECCALIVHHRPKDREGRDLRGHSSLRAGVETAILVEGGAVKSASIVKQKDGPDNERFPFALKLVELGTNSRGKVVTSCVTEYPGSGVEADASPVARAIISLPNQQKLVLRAIGDALSEHGVAIGDPVPASEYNAYRVGKMVAGGHVADRCRSALSAVVDGAADKKADSVDRARRRATEALKTKGIIGTWNDWYWINHR